MGREARVAAAERVVRVFLERPDRVAAAFRRARVAAGPGALDGLVEPFIRALGHVLAGRSSDAWAHTIGVLRLTSTEDSQGLRGEFMELRRCLHDALDALDAELGSHRLLERALALAERSALEQLWVLREPRHRRATLPFGGVVVECFLPESREGRPGPGRALAPLH